MALVGQSRPLGHTEAVLLIGNDQVQIMEGNVLRQQGMGADGQLNFAAGKGFLDLPFFCGSQ